MRINLIRPDVHENEAENKTLYTHISKNNYRQSRNQFRI